MARPRKNEEDKHIKVIKFRLTQKEYDSFQKKADILESEVNDLAREIVLNKKIKTKNITSIKKNMLDYKRLLYELKQEGNNVNQIAKSINAYLKAEGAVKGIKKLFSKQNKERIEQFALQLKRLEEALDSTRQAVEKNKLEIT